MIWNFMRWGIFGWYAIAYVQLVMFSICDLQVPTSSYPDLAWCITIILYLLHCYYQHVL